MLITSSNVGWRAQVVSRRIVIRVLKLELPLISTGRLQIQSMMGVTSKIYNNILLEKTHKYKHVVEWIQEYKNTRIHNVPTL